MSPQSNRKPALGQQSTSKKQVSSMGCKLEHAIWLGALVRGYFVLTGVMQLIITWMSNIKKVHGKPRLHVSVLLLFGVWPLVMITMRKLTHGFPFLSYMGMGLGLAALRAAGAPLLERANAQKNRAKRGHSQNLTYFYFEFTERYLFVFKGFGVDFSNYGLLSGILGKIDFALSLAIKWPNKLAKNSIAKTSSR